MNRDTIKIMSDVAGNLARAKEVIQEIREDYPEVYSKARDLMGDCQDIMARYLDTAPINLIAGKVDDISENIRWYEGTRQEEESI